MEEEMKRFHINGHEVVLRISAPHEQVLPYFPSYDVRLPAPGTIVDYRNPANVTGHQQRALLVYWSLVAFTETGGIGLDLGGAGVPHPACLSLDLVAGEQEHPIYGGKYTNVHIKGDASDLSMFCDNSFSIVLSNHLIEHLPCTRLKGGEIAEEKIAIGCSGEEIADIISGHWLRVLKPNGYLVSIIPDEASAREAGSSVFYQDVSHCHAWTPQSFFENVVKKFADRIEIISFNTLKNNFSFELVCRKIK